jgi:hypothetical protein
VSVEITENLVEWYCGSEENWNQLKDLIEGDFTLNFFPSGQLGNFGPCAGLWLYASDGGVFTFDSGVRIVGWNARSGRFGGSINIFTFGLSSYLPELRCGLNAVRRGSTSADYTEIEQDEGWPCTEIATRAGEALLDFYTWGDVHLIARGKLSIK